MGGSFSFFLRLLIIACGIVVLVWHPSAAWVESAYANGAYARWEPVAHALAAPIPWSLGDVAALLGIAAIAWRIAVRLRKRDALLPRLGRALFDVVVVLAIYAVWFDVSWGWNYDRAPIEARTAFDTQRVTPRAVEGLRRRAIAELNHVAPIAHLRNDDPLDTRALYALWLPAVQAAGDRWTPNPDAPKPTLTDPFMTASGTSGFINPLTLNVHLASDLLWFERPFSLAHEWSHEAAYAREDEANYLAILTCLRSNDPVVRYSGWMELFLYLPPLDHYARKTFSPLVWSDFDALRKRNERHVNMTLAHWSWKTYNAYLKSKRIASGVQNYNEVTRLYLGIPLDQDGLPLSKSVSTPRGTR